MTKTAFNWIFKNLGFSQAWPHETLASIDHQILPGMPVFLFHPLDFQGYAEFGKQLTYTPVNAATRPGDKNPHILQPGNHSHQMLRNQ